MLKSVPVESEDESPKTTPSETETILLEPEQIEEMHADEYALALFNATRVQPLSLNEVKRQLPEPYPKRAAVTLDRFLKVGLVHLNAEGKYYSNYPTGFINYSRYRYDSEIEMRKDMKVFELMKENSGRSDYWRIRSYFSMDTFYSQEQTALLQEKFVEIRKLAKQFDEENMKKGSLKDLVFRRLKFYDMILGVLLALAVLFGAPEKSFARVGGGNDPTKVSSRVSDRPPFMLAGGNDPTRPSAWDSDCLSEESVKILEAAFADASRGGGHDPTRLARSGDAQGGGHDPTRFAQAGQGQGGGHDPTTKVSYGELSCRAETLATHVKACKGLDNSFCRDVRAQAKDLWMRLKGIWDI